MMREYVEAAVGAALLFGLLYAGLWMTPGL
jgi:hypothetical protein